MIKLAIIGTSWITDKFIEAAHETKQFKLIAIYSRNIEKAQQFGEKYNVKTYFTSLDELANSSEIDAVYIASPNSLHYSQSKLMLEHKKHVICEKPITSNSKETESIIQIAKENNKIIFEAFKPPYLPNFEIVKQTLPKLGKLRKAVLNYCQFSSRYPKYLNGENPNTFNLAFSNGSVMDIGVYPLGFAIALWGKPKFVKASASLLDSGVDAHGTIIMNYGDFDVTILHSKVSDSKIPSEIQGEKGNLLIEQISIANKIIFIPREGKMQDITLPQVENTMYYEAKQFAKLVKNNQILHNGLQISLDTSIILTEIRKQTNIVFPADK